MKPKIKDELTAKIREVETGKHHARSMPSRHQQQGMAYQVLDHHYLPIQCIQAVIAFKNKLAQNLSDFIGFVLRYGTTEGDSELIN